MEPPAQDVLRAMARTSPEVPTVWEIAFHEASHAIVAHDLGEVPRRVVIVPEAHRVDVAGTNHFGAGLVAHGWPYDGDDPVIGEMIERTAHRFAAVTVAGDVGWRIAVGLEVDTYEMAVEVVYFEGEDQSTDRAKLVEVVAHLDEERATDWLDDRGREAHAILSRRWEDVRVLASLLVEHGEVDRDQLEDLFGFPRPSLS